MQVTANVYRERLCDVLVREFGHLRNTPQIVARLAGGVSPRTVENWFARICAPQGAALLNLCAQVEAVDAAMAELKRLARGQDR